MTGPIVSVIIPVWNRAELVCEALAVFLSQAVSGLEVIVVDDGSTDSTALVVDVLAKSNKRTDIRLVKQSNAGPGAARNNGAQHANGHWLAFLDSDDVWFPWTSEVLRAELARWDPAFVFLQAVNFKDAGQLSAYTRTAVDSVRHASLYEMRLNAPLALIGSCNMVVRKDIFLAVGGFDTDVNCGEDTDLFFRCGDRGPCLSILAPALVGYRDNSLDSLSRQSGAMERAILYKIRRFQGGHYPDAEAHGRAAMVKMIRLTIQNFFAVGEVGAAYRVYAAAIPILVEVRDWHHVVRLPLTPLLALVRPQNYRFRWRAKAT